MDRVFQIIAVGLAGLAAYFLWAGNSDAAFASAVLGSVSFFLSVRAQVKERNRVREEERMKAEADQPVDTDQ
jgi:hypothetical protein